MKMNYDGRTFRSVSNSASGEVGDDTLFHYHQYGDAVWAEYSGGNIIIGNLVATCAGDGVLDMRYQHINRNGELMTGECRSRPELLRDGRVRLHEKWRWTCGESSEGESVLEEVME